MAQAKLAQFRDLDMPNSVAKTGLSLQRAKDSTVEAAEELKQLEIMYRDQDLEDMTAEFVINRGKRRAERASLSLAIQESEFASLKNHSMPRELRTRELEVIRKTDALRAAQADAEAVWVELGTIVDSNSSKSTSIGRPSSGNGSLRISWSAARSMSGKTGRSTRRLQPGMFV